MGEADLAGLRIGAAADEPGVADRVVRGAERAFAEQRRVGREQSEHGMDLARFERLLLGHGRQDAGHALGEHALAGAGRADEDHVMSARGGDLERAFGGGLPLDFGEIRDAVPVRLQEDRAVVVRDREEFAGEGADGVREGVDGIHADVRQYGRRLAGIGSRDDQRADLGHLFREERGGQDALDRAHGTVERELAEDHGIRERLLRERTGRGGQRQCDRQVERRAFLADVAGREVHERESLGMAESGCVKRAANAFLALADRRVGESDDGNIDSFARTGRVDFDLDRDGVDPEKRGGVCSRKHSFTPSAGPPRTRLPFPARPSSSSP